MLNKRNLQALWLILTLITMFSIILSGCAATQQAAPEQQTSETAAIVEPTAPPTAAPEKEKTRIVFVTPLLSHPVWLQAKYGAEAAAKEYGFDFEWVGPSGIDIDAEIQQIETALATNADAIMNCPINPEAFADVYAKAEKAGVPIVNVQVDTPEDTRLAFIGTGSVEYGQKAAEVLAEKMGGKANIAVLMTSMDAMNQVKELDSFKAVMDAKYPDMKVVVVETDQSDQAVAVDKINQILLAYPEVDAFLMLVGEGAPAAAQVFAEKNIKDIVVLGIDDMEETLQGIRDGWIWGSLNQNYYVMGYEGTKLIMKHFAGEKVPSIVDSGTTLITIENVDSYND